MAFFPINLASKFGRELVQASKHAVALRANVDLQVARVTEMTDQQVASEYGTGLTRAQLLATLTDAQTALAATAIVDLATKIG
jgi:hypothetical protein